MSRRQFLRFASCLFAALAPGVEPLLAAGGGDFVTGFAGRVTAPTLADVVRHCWHVRWSRTAGAGAGDRRRARGGDGGPDGPA